MMSTKAGFWKLLHLMVQSVFIYRRAFMDRKWYVCRVWFFVLKVFAPLALIKTWHVSDFHWKFCVTTPQERNNNQYVPIVMREKQTNIANCCQETYTNVPFIYLFEQSFWNCSHTFMHSQTHTHKHLNKLTFLCSLGAYVSVMLRNFD
jgi:hypothetical protein